MVHILYVPNFVTKFVLIKAKGLIPSWTRIEKNTCICWQIHAQWLEWIRTNVNSRIRFEYENFQIRNEKFADSETSRSPAGSWNILIPVEAVPQSKDNFPSSVVKFRFYLFFNHRQLILSQFNLQLLKYLKRRVAFQGAKIREFTKEATTGTATKTSHWSSCVKLSVLRLFHVGHVEQNRRSALSALAWHEWFSCKGKERKIYCCELALSSGPQLWNFHVFVWQTTSNHCTKRRAVRLYLFIQPMKLLICGVVVDVAVVA